MRRLLPRPRGAAFRSLTRLQAVLRTSDLSLSVGLRAGVPRSKASFGQRGGLLPVVAGQPPASTACSTPRGLQEKGGRNRPLVSGVFPLPARAGPEVSKSLWCKGAQRSSRRVPVRGATPSPSARSPPFHPEGRHLSVSETTVPRGKVCFRCELTKRKRQLLAVDHSARVSMKNAASCEK